MEEYSCLCIPKYTNTETERELKCCSVGKRKGESRRLTISSLSVGYRRVHNISLSKAAARGRLCIERQAAEIACRIAHMQLVSVCTATAAADCSAFAMAKLVLQLLNTTNSVVQSVAVGKPKRTSS